MCMDRLMGMLDSNWAAWTYVATLFKETEEFCNYSDSFNSRIWSLSCEFSAKILHSFSVQK